MKVRDLKAALAALDDDLPVVAVMKDDSDDRIGVNDAYPICKLGEPSGVTFAFAIELAMTGVKVDLRDYSTAIERTVVGFDFGAEPAISVWHDREIDRGCDRCGARIMAACVCALPGGRRSAL